MNQVHLYECMAEPLSLRVDRRMRIFFLGVYACLGWSKKILASESEEMINEYICFAGGSVYFVPYVPIDCSGLLTCLSQSERDLWMTRKRILMRTSVW